MGVACESSPVAARATPSTRRKEWTPGRPVTAFARPPSTSSGRSTAPSVLDLFAGSGAMGLEALSRGAERAVFVESDRAACRAIERNLEKLRLTGARVVCDDVLRFLATERGRYDLVLVDPPYELVESLQMRLSPYVPPCSPRTDCSSSRAPRATSPTCRSRSGRAGGTAPRASRSSSTVGRPVSRALFRRAKGAAGQGRRERSYAGIRARLRTPPGAALQPPERCHARRAAHQ